MQFPMCLQVVLSDGDVMRQVKIPLSRDEYILTLSLYPNFS